MQSRLLLPGARFAPLRACGEGVTRVPDDGHFRRHVKLRLAAPAGAPAAAARIAAAYRDFRQPLADS